MTGLFSIEGIAELGFSNKKKVLIQAGFTPN